MRNSGGRKRQNKKNVEDRGTRSRGGGQNEGKNIQKKNNKNDKKSIENPR